ncbi:MAG: MFS transporter, partial [Candidatus Marinimicrobia bacterium]|nr:MFS transporter [Candidatus Neomarinimicrobiota bacterium]
MHTARQDPMFRYLALLTIASAVGLQTWRTLFNNFAVEIVHLEGNHIGIIQSLREVPGFLALLVIFLIIIIKEHRLSALSIITLGVGVGLTGVLPSYLGLIFTTLIMSFGFHYYETTNQSLTLQYFNHLSSPWVFGKLRSYAAATNIVVGVFILVISNLLSYQMIYILVGGLIGLAGFWGLRQSPTRSDVVPQHKKMILRKKYWLYYFLTFMSGARRQIFVAFAVFLLVKKFEFSV